MPPTLGKKPCPQPIPEPVPEALQTTAIVILHPGSEYLRVGRASDAYPQSIYHCIARRHKNPGQQQVSQDPWTQRPEAQYPFLEAVRLQGLNGAQEALQYRPMTLGGYRKASTAQQLARINMSKCGEESAVGSGVSWTDTQEAPQRLYGEQAMLVHPDDSYDLHWPLRHGRFNLHAGPGGTMSAVVQDLEDIWGNAIHSLLEIPLKDLKHYKAVIMIPDVFERTEVREMLNVVLDRLGFGAAFVVQESMCATLGAGVSSACVVDIGDQKTSVCCVEDGLSQKNTRVSMDYGGRDITRVFLWLLRRIGFQYHDCDISKMTDLTFIQDLKETLCHLDQDLYGIEEQFLQLKLPDQNILKFSMHIGDERILAPLAMFLPDLLALHGDHLVHVPQPYRSDPGDPKDEDYIKQTMSKHEQAARAIAKRKREAAEATSSSQPAEGGIPPIEDPGMDDDDTMDTLDNGGDSGAKNKEEQVSEFLKQGGLIGVDQAILLSIANCESDEMKKRMYSCIVVVGGGLMFPGTDSWIKYLIWTQMPALFRAQMETMDVFTEPKEMDPRYTCWKGGAVMVCLDTAQELWIKQREWRKEGIKLVRERAPFVWTE